MNILFISLQAPDKNLTTQTSNTLKLSVPASKDNTVS